MILSHKKSSSSRCVVWLLWLLIYLFDVSDTDLGWYDTGVRGNPHAPTPSLNNLSASGFVLDRHYAFRYCSPTRRSLLTGRFPNHITTVQPDGDHLCSDFLPLNATILSERLQGIGYKCHFIGKGHLGYQTTDHLPVHRGFDTHVGFLAGSESYHYGGGAANPTQGKHDLWQGLAPGFDVVPKLQYATNFYTATAVDLIEAHGERKRKRMQFFARREQEGSFGTTGERTGRKAEQDGKELDPFFIYFSVQNVHSPYQLPPAWETHDYPQMWNRTYSNMLRILDMATLNVTLSLQRAGVWDDTLILWTSDNGGIGLGNNYPLRGHKHDPWEGGTRVVSFLTGGYLPIGMRGKSSGNLLVHVADWYPTFLHLAGVAQPVTDRVYFHGDYAGSNAGFHDIDGVNVWPMLTGANATQPRRYTPTSEVGIIDVGAAPASFGPPSDSQQGGDPAPRQWWKLIALSGQSNYWTENQSIVIPTDSCLDGAQPDPVEPGRTDAIVTGCPVCNASSPCLYDILTDPSERRNVAAGHPGVVARLVSELARFEEYVSGRIDAGLLAREYEKIDTAKRWEGYLGPCYQRKPII